MKKLGISAVNEFDAALPLQGGQRAARLTFETEGFNADALDPISLKNFGDQVSTNKVANAAMRQVQRIQQKNGGPVRLQFAEGPSGLAGEVGRALDGTIEMEIYMLDSQNMTAKGAVGTFVHESSHFSRASKGFAIQTQLDEYLAFRRELLFDLGRRPTILEKQNMWQDKIENNKYYSKLPVGGTLPKILKKTGE
ncbi:hypothetical protein ASD07_29815 [Duganella sp. Root336D2]|nr:hypothetical protein ASD07_29815 [Duganella sp. Root336D2]